MVEGGGGNWLPGFEDKEFGRIEKRAGKLAKNKSADVSGNALQSEKLRQNGKKIKMKNKKKHILVLAAGSVGRRHLRNFASLGCDVSAMDPREDRLKEANGEVKLVYKFKSVEEALSTPGKFDGAVVASPTKFHISQTMALLKAGLPVLLENPLAKNMEEASELFKFLENNKNAKVLLGYTYRWWPSLGEFRKKISAGEIGRPLRAEFIMSAHLADWHPWEKYQDFFMASRDLGGGALLDE